VSAGRSVSMSSRSVAREGGRLILTWRLRTFTVRPPRPHAAAPPPGWRPRRSAGEPQPESPVPARPAELPIPPRFRRSLPSRPHRRRRGAAPRRAGPTIVPSLSFSLPRPRAQEDRRTWHYVGHGEGNTDPAPRARGARPPRLLRVPLWTAARASRDA